MHTKRHRIAVLVASLLLASLPLQALPKNMLMCLPGFPGTTAQAQPFVDQMLRFLEKKLGAADNIMSGTYISDETEATTALSNVKPELAVVGPSVYAKFAGTMKMKVIARIEASGRGEDTYHVVVRADGPDNLAGIADGSSVAVVGVSDPQYVYNVMLDRKVKSGALNLSTARRPVKALRDLNEGRLKAVIVDQSVKDSLKDLDFAASLRIAYSSKPVPAPAVVVMGSATSDAAKLGTALEQLCVTEEGKKLCMALSISSIRKARDADYADLLKRYSR